MINNFNKPQIISIVSDVNQGKSNLVYHLIKELTENFQFNLYTYGLRYDLPLAKQINSLAELEKIRDSVIFLDEFQSLFNLEDRKCKQLIEQTLRLIHHNNNILVLIGVAENFKKFISSRISVVFYKQVTFENFINGSSIKNKIMNYCGYEKGSSLLKLEVDEVIVFDGSYTKYKIPYLPEFDSKKQNINILQKRSVPESVPKNVETPSKKARSKYGN